MSHSIKVLFSITIFSFFVFLCPHRVWAASCVNLPVLMYHHVQSYQTAKTKGQTSLSVDTEVFRHQMQYLQDKGYTTISASDLIDFFTNHTNLPSKAVMLTFDDAYSDFATDAAPILQSHGFKSIMFTPTGLIDNPGYLSWGAIKSLSSTGLFTFANHTWSHHSMKDKLSVIENEIDLADKQLTEKNINYAKIFAYPYGTVSKLAVNYLTTSNYQLAFTTRSGRKECSSSRLQLPRIRIGSAPLARYGL